MPIILGALNPLVFLNMYGTGNFNEGKYFPANAKKTEATKFSRFSGLEK